MDESIQQQIDETKLQLEETKLQLSDKLGELEQQVSQTVESASTAVTATVEAVQGTVESVAGAVEDAVHNVHHAFDLRYQMEKHPLLVLGGAAFVGFLAAEYFKMPPHRKYNPAPRDSFNRDPYQSAQSPDYVEPKSVPQPAPQSQPAPTAWDNLKAMALSTLMSSMQGVALRAIPEIVGLVVGNALGHQAQQHRESPEPAAPRARSWPEETRSSSPSPMAEQVRSSKLS